MACTVTKKWGSINLYETILGFERKEGMGASPTNPRRAEKSVGDLSLTQVVGRSRSFRTAVAGVKLSATKKCCTLGTVRRIYLECIQILSLGRGQELPYLLISVHPRQSIEFLNVGCRDLIGVEQHEIKDYVSLLHVRCIHHLHSV
jgi:hypothetical protein